MKKINKIRWVFSFVALLCLLCETAVFSMENYSLKPLFELKTGWGNEQFLLGFAPAPFAPGIKTHCIPLGTHVLVDNSGNFYLLKERANIVKINSKGEVIGEIKGIKPFTVPMEMKLDGEDNLYVNFRHETNIVEESRFAVAKFNKQGELLHWIGGEKGFKCIFFTITINGTVSLESCAFEDGPTRSDKFQRYNNDGSFAGLFVHRRINYKDRHTIGYILAVGMDGNAYVINDFDFTVKKYNDYARLTTTEGIEPTAERAVFPWMKIGSKYDFQGFDVNNKMYFYYFPDGRIRKRVDLSKNNDIDVLDFSRPLKLEAFRYDFEQDKYDTLTCEALIKEEGKFATRWALRNYIGELYEVVIFFNDPPKVTPQDHVRFYKWEKVK